MSTSVLTSIVRGVALLAVFSWLVPVSDGSAVAQEEPAAAADGASNELPFDVEDWREAGKDDQNGVRFRSCTIRIGKDGLLTGTVFRIEETSLDKVPVKDIELRLVQDGMALEITMPNADDGEFTFGPVQPGIYSLIGQGADGLVAYSFHVEAAEEKADEDGAASPAEGDAKPAETAQDEEHEQDSGPKIRLINSCAIDPRDMTMAIQMIQAFLGVDTGASAEEPVLDEEMKEGEAPSEEEKPVMESETPAETPRPPSRRAGSFKVHHDADEVQTTALSWHAVMLQEDNSLIGRVRMLVASSDENGELETRPPKDMRVFLIQEGRVVTKAPCSPKGIFVIPDLPVGLYSFVCVGLDGFAAMTVQVLPPEKKPEQENPGIRSASLRRVGFLQNAGSLPNFDTAAVPPGDSNQLQTTPIVVPTELPQNLGDTGPLLTGFNSTGTGGTQPGQGASSFPSVGTGGPSGVGAAGGGGAGGGVAGGGGGRGGGGGGVPEIDPASSGVGLSVLVALLFLLIDLRRPRQATSK